MNMYNTLCGRHASFARAFLLGCARFLIHVGISSHHIWWLHSTIGARLVCRRHSHCSLLRHIASALMRIINWARDILSRWLAIKMCKFFHIIYTYLLIYVKLDRHFHKLEHLICFSAQTHCVWFSPRDMRIAPFIKSVE